MIFINYKKKNVIFISLLVVLLCGCSSKYNNSNDSIEEVSQNSIEEVGIDDTYLKDKNDYFDYDAMGISEYQYPDEFVLEDDIKWAIEQVAKQDNYCQDSVNMENWKNIF